MDLKPHVNPMQQFQQWRAELGLSQARMAELMGVPLRTYEDLERGRSAIRPIHINAAAFALVQHAAENGGMNDLPIDIGEVVKKAAGWR